MNTCYRTLCYGTAIQNILRGSFFKQDNLDLVLVKNYSLQYMRIQTDHSTDENDNDILQPIFEQQAFGLIWMPKFCHVLFNDLNDLTPHSTNTSTRKRYPTMTTKRTVLKSNWHIRRKPGLVILKFKETI
ncbi:unnamed protein product [Absidia cylindrospora]